jgi:hypothetical protein
LHGFGSRTKGHNKEEGYFQGGKLNGQGKRIKDNIIYYTIEEGEFERGHFTHGRKTYPDGKVK